MDHNNNSENRSNDEMEEQEIQDIEVDQPQFYINNPIIGSLSQQQPGNLNQQNLIFPQQVNIFSQNPNNISQGNHMSDEFQSLNHVYQQHNHLQESMVLNINNLYQPNNQIFNLHQVNDNQIQKNLLPGHISETYYKKREGVIKKAEIPQDNEPHMVITVMKTNMAPDQQQKIYVTNDGVVESLKNTSTEDIIIGRQQQAFDTNKSEIHPNDIVLPATDRAISRIHCKIIYKNGFMTKRPVTIDFQTFLLITSGRQKNKWKYLPHYM